MNILLNVYLVNKNKKKKRRKKEDDNDDSFGVSDDRVSVGHVHYV